MKDRITRAWNAFRNKEDEAVHDYGPSEYRNPSRPMARMSSNAITKAIYNRIAIDVSMLDLKHIQVNEKGDYQEDIPSNLNQCLTGSTNLDQTSRDFILDSVLTMLEEGVVAIVPIDTTDNPKTNTNYDILSLRAGRVIQWYPKHVKIEVYNENSGKVEEIVVSKNYAAIIINPLYHVMNEGNSLLVQLTQKLNLLDLIEEQNAGSKFNMILQMPNPLKTNQRKREAEARIKALESQLTTSKFGIGYIDSTEKVTLLNRAADNNVLESIKYLNDMLYGQLGMPESVFNGTATEDEQIAYHNRTINPIMQALTQGMTRTFLTREATVNKEEIRAFRDPFAYASITKIAEMSDSFSRNEILAGNEIRGVIGKTPSDDPRASQLMNKNINQSNERLMELEGNE